MSKISSFTNMYKPKILKSSYIKGFSVILLLFLVIKVNAKNDYTKSSNTNEQQDSVRKTIPYALPWDDMPIDLSFIYANEKPAGKHGFLKVEANKFVFEDGTEARFWGTNFNSAQNFPPHGQSEKVAKRLAKIGVNIVRFHQLDAEWSTPNIFQFKKGKNKPNTMSLDPESMERLDYLIYCLKKEGIYIYMDMLTYRRFRTGDGVEAASMLRDAAKPYSTFNRRMIELQKKFSNDLWNHVNPYTKLAYKDDPAIALVDVTNENDFYTWNVEIEPYRSELENKYREWAKTQNIKVGKEKIRFDKSDKTIQQFFMKVTEDYYKEMIEDMREIGVTIPITGSNLHGDWSRRWGHLSSQMTTDYTDAHAYSRGGYRSLDKNWKFGNRSNLWHSENMLPLLACGKLFDKPFFVSEWDNPWPNEWRAETPLLMAAAASLQDWNGLAIHTYRYTLSEDVDMIAHSIKAGAIGGSYYRAGAYDTFNDPAKFGLFYHAALMFRRGDIKRANKEIAIKADDLFRSPVIKALELTPEKHRVGIILPGMKYEGKLVNPDETVVDLEKGEVLSDTKELYRNLNKKIGWIDSPKTKVVYGLVGKEDKIELNDVTFDVKTDFATLAISSLNDNPIAKSDNMLLTAVGRADNSGMKYNEAHDHVLDVGHGPTRVEVIEATIEIKTEKQNLRAMSVSPQGLITGYMPSEYKDGVFRFRIGKEFQSMYYLIQEL